ncbi:MAG: hypothetical protein ACOC1F_04365 [Myxococcota bacterium]
MPRTRALRMLTTVAPCCVIGAWCAPSLGFEAEVTSETTAQGYQLRNAWGDPVLSRRRFVQTLGLHVSDIGDGDRDGPWVSFRARMRLDADFAIDRAEMDYRESPGAFVPGLQRAPVDLMYGYFDIRNVADGMLSGRLGRQYVIDSLGWWSFDGALVRLELPVYVAMEAYGGLEQREGLPLSNSRFERDGVWRGDRTSLDANVYPGFLEADLAPAWGVVVESLGLPIVHGRVAYRKVWNMGEVATHPFPSQQTGVPPTTDGRRVSQERVGASADAIVDDVGVLRTGAVYDLLRSGITSWYGSVDGYISQRITVGADADRVVPSFDGDSIWNWFATEPTTTLLGRADVGLTKRLRVAVGGGVRWVDLESDEHLGEDAPSLAVDTLGRASARYELDDGRVGLSGMLDWGERGDREGIDLFGDRWFEERYVLSSRISLYDWRDELRPDRSATSFGYVLGGGFRVGDETMARLEWEHDTNELVGQRYRVLASLQLLVNR